jgi:predicted exporter
VARRIVVLVGHRDRAVARRAAIDLSASLGRSGVLVSAADTADALSAVRLGAAYLPYRTGFLPKRNANGFSRGAAKPSSIARLPRPMASSVSSIRDCSGSIRSAGPRVPEGVAPPRRPDHAR